MSTIRCLKLAAWLIIPALAGLAAYHWREGSLQRQWRIVSKSAPLYEGPASVNLGPQEEGQLAQASFWVANRGGGQLVIDEIVSSCSCAMLEEESGGQRRRVETLTLGPGERAELFAQVSVRGPANQPFRNIIQFRTNDRLTPQSSIEILVPEVIGSVSILPSSVSFERVLLGKSEVRVIDVLDERMPARTVTEVSMSNGEMLAARMLTIPSNEQGRESQRQRRLIGRVEVTMNANKPGAVREQLLVTLDQGSTPLKVAVSGEVHRPVEAYPPLLTLPRSSSNGFVYRSRCLCRCTTGAPLELILESASPGLVARVEDPTQDPSERYVSIEWDASKEMPGTPDLREVRLTARYGEARTELIIPVECRRP